MTFLYCVLPDLPTVPDIFIQEAYKKDLKNKLKSFGHLDKIFDSNYINRSVVKDGQTYTSRFQHKYNFDEDLGKKFHEWCHSSLHYDCYHCGVVYNQGTDPYHGPHVDMSRNFVLFYLLESGGVNATTSWWQRPGFPAELDEEIYGKMTANYHELTLIDQLIIPRHTWILFNVRVIHSLENVTKERMSLQCSLPKNADIASLISGLDSKYFNG
jgi:hypothetical protein